MALAIHNLCLFHYFFISVQQPVMQETTFWRSGRPATVVARQQELQVARQPIATFRGLVAFSSSR